jgi:hypothetical protein
MRHATTLAVASLCLCVGGARPAAMKNGVVKFFNEAKFTVEIPGAADASRNIREISIDELTIDIRETTTGLDVEYRLYSPGQAHWGNATLTSACTLGGSKELQSWWTQAARGRTDRRTVTIKLKADDGSSRSYRLVDAKPVAFTRCDPQSPDPTETIVVTPRRIEIGAPGDSQPLAKPLNGFHADIRDAIRVNPDDTWDLVVGGAPSHEDPPLALGLLKDPALDLGPHSTCTDVTLRGQMTDSRHAMAEWINDTVAGRPWRRDLIISQDGAKTRHIFSDGFPVGYVFPHLDVTSQAVAQEEVRVKPMRCDIK